MPRSVRAAGDETSSSTSTARNGRIKRVIEPARNDELTVGRAEYGQGDGCTGRPQGVKAAAGKQSAEARRRTTQILERAGADNSLLTKLDDVNFKIRERATAELRFWNCATLKEERQIALTRHEGLGAATISPDGKWLITSSRPSVAPDPGVITVWDIATGNEKAIITGHTRKIGALAVSPDNKQLAMGGGWMGTFGEVKIFDLPTGKELASFQDHKTWIGGLAFTPDGRWLASGAGNAGKGTEMRIWDMKTLRAKGE